LLNFRNPSFRVPKACLSGLSRKLVNSLGHFSGSLEGKIRL
jgi:hypothetical protein